MESNLDTIAAIATPPGEGGVALIRVSGPQAGAIAHSIFRSMKNSPAHIFASHRIYRGKIVDPQADRVLDDVLLLYFAQGKSYTGDETVEIACHGGPFVAKRILETVLAEGARQAGPGEFTRRAYLAGRLDLAQAEAVADIIAAGSERELANATRQLDGALSEKISAIGSSLTETLAEIESRLDFPDEDDISALPVDTIRNRLATAKADLAELADSYRDGRVLREGYRVAIVGRPNVGKSSLLNRLLGAGRAIVTSEPGTTRDVIEERALLGGIPFVFADTAGLRADESAVGEPEKIGISKTVDELNARKLDPGGGTLIVMLDSSSPLTDDDVRVLESAKDATRILVFNKSDLPAALDPASLPAPFHDETPVRISALKGRGLTDLVEALCERRVRGAGAASDGYLITSARHKAAVDHAIFILDRAIDALEKSPAEILALEVRLARSALDEICGVATPDDVLDVIFSKFCIGK